MEEETNYNDPAVQIQQRLYALLEEMNQHKPDDRTPKDRAWAIGITDMQKLICWWDVRCVDTLGK
jgi:hypothetical protein